MAQQRRPTPNLIGSDFFRPFLRRAIDYFSLHLSSAAGTAVSGLSAAPGRARYWPRWRCTTRGSRGEGATGVTRTAPAGDAT